MDKAKDIAQGFTNLAKKSIGVADQSTENLAAERTAICQACTHYTIKSTCGLCGCYMPAKVRAINVTCPAGQW